MESSQGREHVGTSRVAAHELVELAGTSPDSIDTARDGTVAAQDHDDAVKGGPFPPRLDPCADMPKAGDRYERRQADKAYAAPEQRAASTGAARVTSRPDSLIPDEAMGAVPRRHGEPQSFFSIPCAMPLIWSGLVAASSRL